MEAPKSAGQTLSVAVVRYTAVTVPLLKNPDALWDISKKGHISLHHAFIHVYFSWKNLHYHNGIYHSTFNSRWTTCWTTYEEPQQMSIIV